MVHSVVGGGEMKRLVAAGSTYLCPHVVHSQNARELLPFDNSVVGDLQNSMRRGSHTRIEELRSSGVVFEASFPMVKAGCESEIRELKLVGEVGYIEGEENVLKLRWLGEE